MIKKKLLIGSNNKGKIREFKFYIDHFKIFENFHIIDTSSFEALVEPDENGNSFEENSNIKSHYYFKNTNVASLSDDSGFIIGDGGDFPGIRTARLAKEHGGISGAIKYVFSKNIGLTSIAATFFCSLSYTNEKNSIAVNGNIKGNIIEKPKGKNGFGYDPFFVPLGYNSTFAEMEPLEKLMLSHRYNAFSKLSFKINQIELHN